MGRGVALFFALVLLAACGGGSTVLSGREILSAIPWTAPETARYRLLDGDEVKGTGVLEIASEDGSLVLSQRFEFPDDELSDDVFVLADPTTLRPRHTERLISGPEGERRCEAEYASGTVRVEQRAKDDERTDEFTVPTRSYDSWSDLFLWRTLPFADGYESRYSDVLSCTLTKPQVLSVVLAVKGIERVTVPAGSFQAWRLEIRSGGRTQKAWFADDAARTLVRYDNGDLVFELESRD